MPIIADQKVVGSFRSAIGIMAKPGDIADGLLVQGVPGTLRVNTDKMKGGFGAIFFCPSPTEKHASFLHGHRHGTPIEDFRRAG